MQSVAEFVSEYVCVHECVSEKETLNKRWGKVESEKGKQYLTACKSTKKDSKSGDIDTLRENQTEIYGKFL